MTLHLEPRHLNIIDTILANYDVGFFAFGSRVTGRNRRFSDLDMFYFAAMSNAQVIQLEAEFEESDLPFKVDGINFAKCEQSFQKIMLQNYLCIKSSTQLKKIEQNQLEYLAYLPNKLGCDVQNISGVTIINCSLDTTIVYGAPQHVNYALAAIKNICTRQALSWWIPPSERNPHITTELIANGLSVQSINAAMFGNVSTAVRVQ